MKQGEPLVTLVWGAAKDNSIVNILLVLPLSDILDGAGQGQCAYFSANRIIAHYSK